MGEEKLMVILPTIAVYGDHGSSVYIRELFLLVFFGMTAISSIVFRPVIRSVATPSTL